jgi:hypothetical protein
VRPTTVLAAVAFALVCLALAWVTTPADPFAKNAPPATETFAIGFDTPSARAIEVSGAGLTAQAERADAGWTLSLPTTGDGPTTWPANPDAVRALLTELATQAIEAAPADAIDGGVAGDPLATITIGLPGAPTMIEVLDQPLAGRLPVRVTAGDGPRLGFVPADRFRPLDAGQLAALAEPRPFNTPGVITRLAVTPRGAPGFAVVRAGGIWRIDEDSTGGVEPRLHQPTVRAIIDDLQAIRAASVVVPASVGADAPARTDPFLSIEATADLPRAPGTPRRRSTTALVVAGESTVEGLTDALATRTDGAESHALQVRLDPQAFPALPADVGSLLDPVPLPWDASEIVQVGIWTGNEPGPLFSRTIDGWFCVTPEGDRIAPGDGTAIRSVLAMLSEPWASVGRADGPRDDGSGLAVRLRHVSSNADYFLRLRTGADSVSVTDGEVVWTGSGARPGGAGLAEALARLAEAPAAAP